MTRIQTLTVSVALTLIMFVNANPQRLGAVIVSNGNVLSFNAVGGAGGMSLADQAGAPGANVGRWNNVLSTGSSPFAGGITAGNILDANATGVASATAMTYSWSGSIGGSSNSGSNDTRMFNNEWDPFGASPDVTFNVTNIPFEFYQVVTYHHSANFTSADRGGDVTANGVTKALRMFQVDGDNPNGTHGYVETDFSGTFDTIDPTNVARGTFVHFDTNLSGDLTLTIEDRIGARLRFSGFQIIEMPVPEPSTSLLLGIGVLGLVRHTRRRRRKA